MREVTLLVFALAWGALGAPRHSLDHYLTYYHPTEQYQSTPEASSSRPLRFVPNKQQQYVYNYDTDGASVAPVAQVAYLTYRPQAQKVPYQKAQYPASTQQYTLGQAYLAPPIPPRSIATFYSHVYHPVTQQPLAQPLAQQPLAQHLTQRPLAQPLTQPLAQPYHQPQVHHVPQPTPVIQSQERYQTKPSPKEPAPVQEEQNEEENEEVNEEKEDEEEDDERNAPYEEEEEEEEEQPRPKYNKSLRSRQEEDEDEDFRPSSYFKDRSYGRAEEEDEEREYTKKQPVKYKKHPPTKYKQSYREEEEPQKKKQYYREEEEPTKKKTVEKKIKTYKGYPPKPIPQQSHHQYRHQQQKPRD